MSLLSVLNIGTRALHASQLSMDVTGQNISNADVEGYSRKRLNLSPDYRHDSSHGQMGLGVQVINIERMRNTFIDQQIRKQNREVGYFEEIDHTFTSIENIFTEPSDTGLLTYMDQFFDSWQNLANNPADASARKMVQTNAEILSTVFHNISGELRDLRSTRNEEITQRVNKVNQIAEQIYNLNQEIGAVEIKNQNANDSRDRRDLLLKELSKYTDISVTENSQGQITVTTAGNILVSPVNVQKLEITTASRKTADGSTIVDVGVRFAESKRQFNPQGGQIKGLFDSRDTVIPEYQQMLDKIAIELAESINNVHVEGYTLRGYSGIQFFDPEITGASDIRLSASIMSDIQNIAAASSGESQPAATNSFPTGTHDFGTPAIQLVRDPAAAAPVSARNVIHGTVTVRTPSIVLQEGVDYHVDYVHGTLQMLHAGFNAEDITVDFQFKSGGSQGPGDNSNALAIARLRARLTMNPDTIGNPTSTFGEFYGSLIGRLGLSRNQAQSNLETRNFLVEQYEAHQDSIAGVSLDEEMANLIRFQHTYQSAARLISTADRMLEVLMNI